MLEQENKRHEDYINSFINPSDRGGYRYRYERNDDGYPYIVAILLDTETDDATDEIKQVGYLKWDHRDGEIESVDVEEDYWRQGIASEMYHIAMGLSTSPAGIIAPKHSKIRTSDGDEWADSVGGNPGLSDAKFELMCPPELRATRQPEYRPKRRPVTRSWFHSTPEELEDGAQLTPGSARGVHNFRGDQYANNEAVWIEPAHYLALGWGSQVARASGRSVVHIYEVQPSETPKKHGNRGWSTTSAIVVKKVTSVPAISYSASTAKAAITKSQALIEAKTNGK
jgi:hypothetical protein